MKEGMTQEQALVEEALQLAVLAIRDTVASLRGQELLTMASHHLDLAQEKLDALMRMAR